MKPRAKKTLGDIKARVKGGVRGRHGKRRRRH